MELITERKEVMYYVSSKDSGIVLGLFNTREEAVLYSAQVPESTRVRVIELTHYKEEG